VAPAELLTRVPSPVVLAGDLTPRIVCEVDELGAIAELISAGIGVGLVPGIARRGATQAPLTWVTVDHPECRRTVTLFRSADSHLSTAARLMRTTIDSWNWIAGEPQERRG
jgi:DNA-binding transcriptional LysR family regulator